MPEYDPSDDIELENLLSGRDENTDATGDAGAVECADAGDMGDCTS